MRFILNAHRFLFSLNFRDINWRSWKTWVLIALVTLLLLGVPIYFALSVDESSAEVRGPREVRVAPANELASGGRAFSIIAEVQSVNEATISPDMGGRVSRVSATLGAYVSAGQILAELENDSERAAVVQAEGAYDAAKASLKKVQGGTRSEQLAILQAALLSARGSAVTALLTAYASVDSAVNDTADQMFTGIEAGYIQFTPSTSNQERELDLELRRGKLSSLLIRQESSSKSISVSSDLEQELQRAENEVREVRTFIDIILAALGDAIDSPVVNSSDIAAYKSDSTAARTSLTSALSTLVSAKSSLQTAAKNLEQGETGAQAEDVDAAEAALKQTRGAYNAAVANLEKTIIRSPISGTLANFTIKLGDRVAAFQEIALVSNAKALEAVASMTEEDVSRITISQKVLLDGGITGTITKIARALDPITRRIEVRIGLPVTAAGGLSNGQSIGVEIEPGTPINKPKSGPLSIPITAIKLEANRTVVYTVVDGVLVAQEITIGRLSGEYVQVTAGLDADTEIVVDVRGLKEGDPVKIQNTNSKFQTSSSD